MMMRPAEDEGVVVAKFEDAGPGLRFEPGDAIWAIGGKWEQQFMGHDGETETLLPGSWHEVTQEWDFRGWDGWERPVPLERCHGCHTVGLNVETGEFVEANIGCESCHGPSAWHVRTWGLGQVYSGVESEVCGQCHSRGTDLSGRYFYPVDYEPGGPARLEDVFDFLEVSPGQDSTHWWGNGHARKRHQEFQAWSQGGHVNALRSLTSDDYDGRYGGVDQDCLRCHSADYILAEGERPSVAEAINGITCAVCHNSHGHLEAARTECESCHGAGPLYHQPQISRIEHVPCPQEANVTCVDCHMPKTGMIGGGYELHSHSPSVVDPVSIRNSDVGTSCQDSSCHATESRELLIERFDSFYGSEDPPLLVRAEEAHWRN
jgi:hypothetical protein